MGIRISEMEEATTFGADDYVPIVSNGTNKKAIGSKIKAFIKGGFTAARAVVTDAEGNLSTSNVTSAELANLSGIDRNINGYLTNKAFPTGGVVDNFHAATGSNQDYNGIYWLQKTQWADMPAGSYGFLEVEGGMQRFTPYGTQGRSDVYIRVFINNAWTPWKEISPITSTSNTGTGGFELRRYGNITEIKGNGVRADQLGIIPSGFMPVSNSYLPIATITDGSNHYYSGYLYVNSANGEIQARYLNNGVATLVTASNWQVYVCAQYVS